MTDDNSVDKTFENESTRDTHMVRISVREYDALRDEAKEAVNTLRPSLISIIDKIEELTRALKTYS